MFYSFQDETHLSNVIIIHCVMWCVHLLATQKMTINFYLKNDDRTFFNSFTRMFWDLEVLENHPFDIINVFSRTSFNFYILFRLSLFLFVPRLALHRI